MAFDEASIIDLAKLTLPGDTPCGRDISADDEEFLAIEAEVVKLDRIDLGEPDWGLLEQASLSILRTKSKDVQVAYALALTSFKKNRYPGLAASLGLLAELVAGFWDNLFPARPRRRKSKIESLGEFLIDRGWLSGDGQPRSDDFDALDRCVARLEQLKTALTEKMPDDPPDFAKFARKLKELAATRPKAAEPAPAPAAGGPAPAGGAATGAAAFVAGEVQDVSGAVKAVLGAATYLRQADASNPLPYAITRFVKWGRIELPATDAARRQIEPPEKSLVEGLTHQMTKGLWEPLLGSAEGAFRSNDPLWLDLQRYACAALQGLGPPFERARTTVMDLTGALVRRLGSGVYDLAFRDGTPLCGGETKMWLEAEVVKPQGGGGGGAVAGDGKLTEAWEGARKLAGTGKLAEAVKALQDGLLTCAQRRDRFLWRLRIAQLCFDAKRLQLAAPLLEE
jgi:type VI secretion system protein VasJ